MKSVTKLVTTMQKLVDEAKASGTKTLSIRVDSLESWIALAKKPDARGREDGSALSKHKRTRKAKA